MIELTKLIPKEYERKESESDVEWFDKKWNLKFQLYKWWRSWRLEKFQIIPPIKKGDKEYNKVIKSRESSGYITEFFYDQKGFLIYEQDNFGHRKLCVSNGYEVFERNSSGITKRTTREEKRGSGI